ncbi:MAG: hypothetical protein GY904_34165 [Planctomycetaceae bacterium]|nr:hypothetical protein [Planctomycetaceae bacterium]
MHTDSPHYDQPANLSDSISLSLNEAGAKLKTTTQSEALPGKIRMSVGMRPARNIYPRFPKRYANRGMQSLRARLLYCLLYAFTCCLLCWLYLEYIRIWR